MQTITLRHTEGATTYEENFEILSLRGMDVPDSFLLFGVRHQYANGNIDGQTRGFNKIITVDFGVVEDNDKRKFLLNFMKSDRAQLQYGSLFSNVVLFDPGGYEDEWIEDLELARRFIVSFIDSYLYRIFSTAAIEADLAYISAKVEVIGTKLDPEWFETNVGKLATQKNGQFWPVFNAATHDFSVLILNYQGAPVFSANDPDIVLGNIKFQLAMEDLGSPAPDGKFYVTVTILLQEKPA